MKEFHFHHLIVNCSSVPRFCIFYTFLMVFIVVTHWMHQMQQQVLRLLLVYTRVVFWCDTQFCKTSWTKFFFFFWWGVETKSLSTKQSNQGKNKSRCLSGCAALSVRHWIGTKNSCAARNKTRRQKALHCQGTPWHLLSSLCRWFWTSGWICHQMSIVLPSSHLSLSAEHFHHVTKRVFFFVRVSRN